MHTTVVLGCPIEQVADSELVPTPDESLIISLVSPRLLSVRVPQQKVSVSNPKTKPARWECEEFPFSRRRETRHSSTMIYHHEWRNQGECDKNEINKKVCD